MTPAQLALFHRLFATGRRTTHAYARRDKRLATFMARQGLLEITRPANPDDGYTVRATAEGIELAGMSPQMAGVQR